jgi:peptidoglycan hydrolase FlgJ
MTPLATMPQSGLAVDQRSLDGLRGRAARDPQGAVREAARQFEALFMSELLKSMRSTTLAEEGQEADLSGRNLSTSMLDGQLATTMSGRLGGLSDAIQRQLERQMGLNPGPIPRTETPAAEPLQAPPRPVAIPQTGALGFVQQHQASARRAEAETGIPAAFMVSQAALETGWGRKEILHADGSPSHNLFGIKATPGWKGAVAEVTTTEYIDGRAQKLTARFRAYASPDESFADYARLMKASPRYAAATARVAEAARSEGAAGEQANAQRFAQGLQQAGYATDPAYADKLSRVINTTLRLQRSTNG